MTGRVRIRGFIAKPGASQAPPVVAEPPAVWMINRLGINDDGEPLQQAIFSNYNDDIILEADSGTLLGRFSPARGPAERITLGGLLQFQNGVLTTGPVGGLPEAPVDNRLYGRKNSSWAEVLIPVLEAPVNGFSYVRKNAGWTQTVADVTKAYVDGELAKYLLKTGGTLTGVLNTVGVTMGSTTAGVATDLSKHLSVWGTAYGLSVTGGTLNLVANGAATLQLTSTLATLNGGLTAQNGSIFSNNGSRFSPANSDTAGLMASGSYGGGLTFQDGAWRAAIWAQSSNLALATGVANPPSIRLLLQADNNHWSSGPIAVNSDQRLKEDFRTFEAGAVLDQIEVHDFRWKETGKRAYGAVAQQVLEVYPPAAYHDEENDRWGIAYSMFVPLLLQEIKALRIRVAELERGKPQ